jgi:hypothetical protein
LKSSTRRWWLKKKLVGSVTVDLLLALPDGFFEDWAPKAGYSGDAWIRSDEGYRLHWFSTSFEKDPDVHGTYSVGLPGAGAVWYHPEREWFGTLPEAQAFIRAHLEGS